MCTSFRNILWCMRSSRPVPTPSFPSGLLSVVGQPVYQQVCTSMHTRSGRSNKLAPEGLPGNYARDCSTSSRSSTVTSSVAAAEDEEEGDDNNDEEEGEEDSDEEEPGRHACMHVYVCMRHAYSKQ